MMKDMKHNSNVIEDSKLEAVAGGNITMGDRMFSDYVDSQSAVAGQNYFVLLNDGRNWTYGTLTEIIDRDIFGSKCERRYNFQLHIINGTWTEVPQRYTAANVSLYRNCLTLANGKF